MTCEQLWEQKGKPKSQREQEAIQMLRNDPQMASAFLNSVGRANREQDVSVRMIP